MRRGWSSDTAYVAPGRRWYFAIRRNLLGAIACATLLALCVCCCTIASTAPAATPAKAAASHASAPVKHKRHRRFRCAKGASFHSIAGTPGSTGKPRRKRHFCLKHRHSGRHHAVRHKATPAPSPLSGYGSCANALLRPSDANLSNIRAATLCLVNRERTSRGESALKDDGQLQQAAQGHSESMAAKDYFEHDGQSGDTPLSRMRSAGYIFSSHIGYAVGENIAWGTLSLATPKAIVAGWMASPGHRANILDATFRDTGVGVAPHPLASLARGQAGAIYTQDFGRIIKP